MSYARLNTFQQLAQQWDQLHPYNAIQVMRLRGGHSEEQLLRSWQETLLTLGVGKIQRARRRYRHLPSTSRIIQLSEDACLQSFIAEQMNLPFDLDREGPLRAFTLTQHGEQVLGIVYYHWLADSFSIRTLMSEWHRRLTGQDARQGALPIIQPPWQLPSVLRLDSAIAALVQWHRSGHNVRRLPKHASGDLSVSQRLLELPQGIAQDLRMAARQRNVKVTDLLLCSIGLVVDRHLPPSQPWRSDLTLGNTRDIRAQLPPAQREAFGVALSLSQIICPAHLLRSRDELLRHIARHNQRNRKRPTRESGGMHVAIAVRAFLDNQRLAEFYRRHASVSAGLSNVDLTNSYLGQQPDLLEFYRVSPCGPMMPLVVTPTTLRGQINISLTWRRCIFTEQKIRELADDLITDLTHWLDEAQKSGAAQAVSHGRV